MDTNLISQLLTALVQRQAETPGMPMSTMLWIAAIAPTLASIAAYISAKASKDEARASKDEAKAGRDDIQKVHEAVNSERTAMVDEVKRLRDEILLISTQKAKLEEEQSASVSALKTIVSSVENKTVEIKPKS